MMCFYLSLFLFIVMNFIKTIMYELCTGNDNDYWIMYFIRIMDNYGQIMGIIDHY